MRQATFTISGLEFNNDVVEKIKSLFNGKEQDFEIFIRVKAKETQKEINQRIEDAARELERNENTVFFASAEFENLVQNLSKR